MNRSAHKKRISGFTLIETLIYVGLFSLIATTLISLSYGSALEDRKTTDNVIRAYEDI